MAQEFTKCKTCGIIFLNADEAQALCPKCIEQIDAEPGIDEDADDKDSLRILKNVLRDAQAKGEMLNTDALAELTGIPEPKIWHFIKTGEVDTAAFSDPKVREFLKRKRIERARELAKAARGNSPSKPEAKKVSRGFHRSSDDKRR